MNLFYVWMQESYSKNSFIHKDILSKIKNLGKKSILSFVYKLIVLETGRLYDDVSIYSFFERSSNRPVDYCL